jgi:ABC-type lipoprotein release transport system permease subunit
MPLSLVQEFLQAPGQLTAYALDPAQAIRLSAQATSIKKRLGENFEVMTWSEMLPDIQQHIETDTRNMRIVQWVLYLLVGFGIFGTLLMLMSERLHEFGMLMALGLQKIQLAAVLIWESMFVFGLGVAFGLVASIPMILLLHHHPIRIGGSVAAAYERFGFEAVFPAAMDIRHFWEQGVTVLCMGLILSLYLVIRVYRLDPVKAMR